MKKAITFEIDTDQLQQWTDDYLAKLWYIAQANPARISDRDAGALAEYVGREIIRRWLGHVPPPLWDHQGRHADSCLLGDLGHWEDGGKRFVPNQVPAQPPGVTKEELLEAIAAEGLRSPS